MSKSIFGVLLGGVVCLGLIFAGCGGGDDETTALTKQQFLKQGNALCKAQAEEREDKVEAFVAKADPTVELGDKAKEDLMLEILPTYEKSADELEALGAPEGDEQKVEEIVKAMKKASSDAKSELAVAVETKKPFLKANELVSEYGLTDCLV